VFLEVGLDDSPAQTFWEELMSSGSYFPASGNIVDRNRQIGMAQGKAEDVLRLLDRRGIAVSEVDRRRVVECDDLDSLNAWFDRAITAETADEVFAEPSEES
jgi:hypothetical protein